MTSHILNFALNVILTPCAVRNRVNADVRINTAVKISRARALKEKKFIVAVARAGISEKPGVERMLTCTR